MNKKNLAIFLAISAAALYAINIPISKILLKSIAPSLMAGFLYLGAGLGMLIWTGFGFKLRGLMGSEKIEKEDMPYVLAMVILDILAPILLMYGISRTSSANVSLLNNFEIVATSLIALIIFKEEISKKLWLAIGFITIASIILTFEGEKTFTFNLGSVFVLLASTAWGFENNSTRKLSNKSSEQIVIIKGIFSGLGSLIVGLILGENLPSINYIFISLILGFVAYGLSINFYIMAQKDLGAAKTSAFYSIAPFLGVTFSIFLLGERPGLRFFIALAIILIGTVIMIKDNISIQHTHEHSHVHNHMHKHGNLVHCHEHSHIHSHIHTHGQDLDSHTHKHQDLYDHNHEHEVV